MPGVDEEDGERRGEGRGAEDYGERGSSGARYGRGERWDGKGSSATFTGNARRGGRCEQGILGPIVYLP